MTENSFPQYDEDEAIVFIRQTLPSDVNQRYNDNDLMEVIDAIWDYYDTIGATSLDNLDADMDDDVPNLEEMAQKIMKTLSKNGPKGINLPDLTLIIKGELAYEEDLGSDF